RGIVAFELTNLLLGWAGGLIQEAAPRRALMGVEPEVKGKLFANPGKGVVVVLIWTRSYPTGSARGVTKTTPWIFDRVETFASATRRSGESIRNLPQNIQERRVSRWVPPIPQEQLPPEKSSVPPSSYESPDIDVYSLTMRGEVLGIRGENLLKERGTPGYQKKYDAWIHDKNAWNAAMHAAIDKLHPEWDAFELSELRDALTGENEQMAAIMQENATVRTVPREAGRWLVVARSKHGQDPRVFLPADAVLDVIAGGFTAKDGTVWKKVRVRATGQEGFIQAGLLVER
ncbi:MAG: hypothetical protein KDC87_11140, partial [Planctomycetes bacterium]|nr:hypothetical protein [Planctomycetota bacterium]